MMNNVIKKFFGSKKREQLANYSKDLDAMLEKKKTIFSEEYTTKINEVDSALVTIVDETKNLTNSIISKLSRDLDHAVNRLETITDNLNEGVIYVSNRGIIHSVNTAAERILRYSNKEIQGKAFTKVFNLDFDDTIEFGENVKRLNSSEMGFLNNTKICDVVCSTKKTIKVEYNIYSLVDEIEDCSYICIIRDIDMQLKSIFKIDNLIKLKFDFFDMLPFPIYWKDKGLNYQGCNESGLKIFNKTLGVFDYLNLDTSSLKFGNVKNVDTIVEFSHKKEQELLDSKKNSIVYKLEVELEDRSIEYLIYKIKILDDQNEFQGIIAMMCELSNKNDLFSFMSHSLFHVAKIPVYFKDQNLRIINYNQLYEDRIKGNRELIKRSNEIDQTIKLENSRIQIL
jgi:PAS domain S-box-containing protein